MSDQNRNPTTNDAGNPVASDEHALSVGADGPIVLHDHYLMEQMAADTCSPDTRLSDDMNHINPAKTATLTQLMLGGLPTGRVGSPLYCRLRYFDPDNQRAGIPEDVAALVEKVEKTTLEEARRQEQMLEEALRSEQDAENVDKLHEQKHRKKDGDSPQN